MGKKEEYVDPRHVTEIAEEVSKLVKWKILFEVDQCLNIPYEETAFTV